MSKALNELVIIIIIIIIIIISDAYTNYKWCSWSSHHNIYKGTGGLRNNYREDFRRLEVSWCHSNSSERPSSNAGVETIQTIKLLRTAKILRKVLETWGDLLSLKLHSKTIS